MISVTTLSVLLAVQLVENYPKGTVVTESGLAFTEKRRKYIIGDSNMLPNKEIISFEVVRFQGRWFIGYYITGRNWGEMSSPYPQREGLQNLHEVLAEVKAHLVKRVTEFSVGNISKAITMLEKKLMLDEQEIIKWIESEQV